MVFSASFFPVGEDKFRLLEAAPRSSSAPCRPERLQLSGQDDPAQTNPPETRMWMSNLTLEHPYCGVTRLAAVLSLQRPTAVAATLWQRARNLRGNGALLGSFNTWPLHDGSERPPPRTLYSATKTR